MAQCGLSNTCIGPITQYSHLIKSSNVFVGFLGSRLYVNSCMAFTRPYEILQTCTRYGIVLRLINLKSVLLQYQ